MVTASVDGAAGPGIAVGVDACQREVLGQASIAPVTLRHGLPGVDSSGGGAGRGGTGGDMDQPLCAARLVGRF